MSECWSEGDLRAFVDRELPPEQMQQVAVHLEVCSDCGDLWSELAGRAARLSTLMAGLAEPAPAILPFERRRSRVAWRWAAAAIAAGITLGVLVLPRRQPQVAAVPASPPITVKQPPDVVPAAQPPVARSVSARPRRQAGIRAPTPGLSAPPFLPLDDEPIESGVVVRMELGPHHVPADVILSPDGRPRAIRLVNFKPHQ